MRSGNDTDLAPDRSLCPIIEQAGEEVQNRPRCQVRLMLRSSDVVRGRREMVSQGSFADWKESLDSPDRDIRNEILADSCKVRLGRVRPVSGN